jgi:predicted anti-sigma-YlaC factor YlaD
MCQELVETVTEYLEETLPVLDRVRFEAHLRKCEDCRNYLDQMRRTVATLGMLTEDAIPAGERDRLLDLFRNWKQAEQ